MKHLKTLFLSLTILATALAFSSCGGASDSDDLAYSSAYTCPMHCKGSGSDQPGKCPVCKMDYEKNKDYKGEKKEGGDESGEKKEHDHGTHDGHNHDGHNHGSHEGHNH